LHVYIPIETEWIQFDRSDIVITQRISSALK
jgi:hypothetical protein